MAALRSDLQTASMSLPPRKQKDCTPRPSVSRSSPLLQGGTVGLTGAPVPVLAARPWPGRGRGGRALWGEKLCACSVSGPVRAVPPLSPTITPPWAPHSPAARCVGGLRSCWHLISLEKPRPQLLPPAHRALLAAPLCLGNCGASAAGVALKTEPSGIRGLCVCDGGVLGEEDPGSALYAHLPFCPQGHGR